MRPDVIVAWPRSCDYPLWRRFITAERERFGRVLIAFTEHDGPDYRDFVRAALPFAQCFDAPTGEDWRDAAVNAALDRSDAEWVWFTEQDFLIHDPAAFWASVASGSRHHAIGFRDDTRWHPACLFVRRSMVDATSRYFGPDPVDHFVTFSRQLRNVYDLDADLARGVEYEHLQGLSHNHHLVGRGEDAGVFRRDRFREYLAACLRAGVSLEAGWRAGAEQEVGAA